MCCLIQDNRQSDVALRVLPSVRLESNWARHSVNAEVSGVRSYYKEFESENEESLNAQLRGRLDITKRTTLEAGVSYDLTQEDRTSLDTPAGATERTDVTALEGFIEGNHRFNRLSVRLRGTVTRNDYGEVALQSGGVESNDDRDNVERVGTLRLAYEVSPRLSIFTDGELSRRDFSQAVDDDGFRRDAKGYLVAVGAEFELGPKLRGTVRVGYSHEDLEDSALADIDGIVYDASLVYRPSVLTTLTLTAVPRSRPPRNRESPVRFRVAPASGCGMNFAAI